MHPLRRLHHQNAARHHHREPRPEAFPNIRRLPPEPPRRRHLVKHRRMAFRHERMPLQLCLKLPQRVGAAIAIGRCVRTRPQPRAVRHDEQRLPPRPQNAPRFFQKRRRLFGGLKPVQHDQSVHHACLDGPERFLTEHRNIRQTRRPRHHPLRPRHQGNHPPCFIQIGPQQGCSEPEPDHRLMRRFRPEPLHLAAHNLLRRAPQGAAIIEVPQILYVQMHCTPAPLGPLWGKP